MKPETLIFFVVFAYLFLPAIFERYNLLIKEKWFFVINYLLSIVCIFFYVRIVQLKLPIAQLALTSTLVSPFLFLNFYKLFEWIIYRKYKRQFVITNKYISKAKWTFNFMDELFSGLLVIGAILLPLLFFKMILRIL